jgi:hypothetical protein
MVDRHDVTTGGCSAGDRYPVRQAAGRHQQRHRGTPDITAEVLPSAVDELKLDDGGELWATVSSSAITVYPP